MGRTLWDCVPQPGALGTVLSACSAWKTCLFPTPDLEMLFSCANVLSCEAAVPFAVEQCPSSHGPAGGSYPCPGKLCLRF